MSTISSDSSSGVFSITTSETSLDNADVVHDSDESDSIISCDVPERDDVEYKLPEHLIKIRELQKDSAAKLDRANGEVRKMCERFKQMKDEDESLKGKKSREITTSQFYQNSGNQYRLRREEHETRLAKLREEQFKIQESIFGMGKH